MDYSAPEGYDPQIWAAALDVDAALGLGSPWFAYRLIQNAILATEYDLTGRSKYGALTEERRLIESYRPTEFRRPSLYPLPGTDPLVRRVTAIMQAKGPMITAQPDTGQRGNYGAHRRIRRRRGYAE